MWVMELHKVQQLERRITEAVDSILAEGDQIYLRGLTRDALFAALETEIQFLGLYQHSNKEAPKILHEHIDRHLDDWMQLLHAATQAKG